MIMILRVIRSKLWLGFLVAATVAVPAQAEMIMVDKAEYESLKKAVEFLMSEQKKAMDAATRAEEKADEATEIAVATAEVVEEGPMAVFEGISLGGYGEVHYNNYDAKDSARDKDDADLHRFVIFLNKDFSDDLRIVSEFEIEHGGVEPDGDPLGGEVEMEQAYLEYDMSDHTQVRGGVFLVPAGILNETHEPPTFYGVERNVVENIIIPSTWWEIGAGVTHRWDNGFSADVAVHTGLEIPDSGRIRSGRQKASNVEAEDLATTVRLRYTGMPGLELAGSVQFQKDANQEGGDMIEDAQLYTAHAVLNKGPFGLTALYAKWELDGDIEDDPSGADEQDGWYITPSFKPVDWLGLYASYQDVDGARTQDQFEQWEVGFNWWLHPSAVVKANYKDREHDESSDRGRDFDGFDLGVGWMF
ncbi:MAG: porin [Proteobacteria bacterium]|nr:porin [Pseudomonadota bacterium]